MRKSNVHCSPGRGQRRGIALVWVILMTSLLIAIGGLALDTGYVYTVRHQLQLAADSAALAGAAQISTNPSAVPGVCVADAKNNFAANSPVQLSSSTDVILGVYNQTTGAFTTTSTSPNAVHVIARRETGSPGGPLNLIFGKIFGVNTAEVQADSYAMSSFPAAFVALDTTASNAFQMAAGTSLDLSGTNGQNNGIEVDSSASTAVNVSTSATATDFDAVHSVGGVSGASGTPPKIGGGLIVTGANAGAPDPCASIPDPTLTGITWGKAFTQTTNTHTFIPAGYYTSITCSAGTVSCNAGTVYCGSGGCNFSGSGCLDTSSGCCIVCTSSDNGKTYGACSINTSGVCNLKPCVGGSYDGCSIHCDSRCTKGTSCNITCGGGSDCSGGCVHAPKCSVNLGCSGSQSQCQCPKSCIGDTCKISSGSWKTSVTAPSVSTGGVCLVEVTTSN